MIDNPLQMNDWGIKKFLVVVSIVQVSAIGLAVLSSFGIVIPLLQQIIGFVYLVFIPGILILRILRIHRLGSVVTLLYTVGISLALNMFLGFLINLVYPVIGIAHPISPVPLFVTWAIVLGLLCIGAYLRDKNYSYPNVWNLAELLSPSVLFLISLPLLAIIGALVVNYYDNNIVLLGLMILIALAAIVIISTKIIPAHLYPLAAFSVALALLWHSSFISNHLTGWDIFSEYYYYSQVIQSGIWDLTVPQTYNAMLSITILPAVCTYFLNMSGEAIFKIVYPLFYALVPLALCTIYDKQLGRRQGFAATFIFISIFVFFLSMISVDRQMIGEVFVVLLIMLIVDRQITSSRKILFILFGASLVVSHYSLSYIFMAFLIISVIILYLLKERKSQITIYSVILFGVICLSWYIFISSSAPFTSIVDIGKQIYQGVMKDFLNLFNREPLSVFTGISPNIIYLIYRILYYLIFFFTAVGALRLLPRRNNNFSKEYLAFAVGSYALLAATIIVPFFSRTLGYERMFHIAAIVLSPFTILGIEDTLKTMGRLIRFATHDTFRSFSNLTVSLLLALFFLFNTGFIFEMTSGPKVDSLPLSLGAIEKDTRYIQIDSKIKLRYTCPTEQEISSAGWLANRRSRLPIYATFYDIRVPSLVAYGLIPEQETYWIAPNGVVEIRHAYVYLGYVNVVYGYGVTSNLVLKTDALEPALWHITDLNPVLTDSSRVYDNGVSEIYWSP
jgi:uncharacterized membrane protein